MPTFTTIYLPPPLDWSEFEDLCRDLWADIWEDPTTQRNGRSGQGQDGVDVFGRPRGELSVEGVQCKVRNQLKGQHLTESDVVEAIEDAERFAPPLSKLIIATTSSRDANLQAKVRLIEAARIEQGKFPVSILFWEEIQSRLVERENILNKYYGFLTKTKVNPNLGNASPDDLHTYINNFQQHVTADLPSIIPTRLASNGSSTHSFDLIQAALDHNIIHLYGPSGVGKSHLARHLAINLAQEQHVPILAPAKYYTGSLHALLNRSLEHLTTIHAESLISGAVTIGLTPLLVLDGFNECPEALKSDLGKDLKALLLRRSVRILITGRPETAFNFLPSGPMYTLDTLAPDEKESLISYYGGLAGDIVDILKTPLDVRIAAENAGRITSSSPTQYDLFHAYARGRLSDASSSGFVLLTECAGRMTEVLTSALSESEFHRIAQVTAGTKTGELINAVRDSGLVALAHGHCSFWHEKIQRFFQAEALLLQYSDKADLAVALRSPRNEDTLEFVLGALKDASAIQLCLPAIRSEALLLSLLHGGLGATAAAAIKSSLLQQLSKAHQELKSIVLTKHEEASSRSSDLSISSAVSWGEHEQAMFNLIGTAFTEGYLCEEVLEIIEQSEKECLIRASEIYPKHHWKYLFPALYVGLSPSSLPVSRIIQAIQRGSLRAWSPVTRQALSALQRDLEHQSPGILFLLSLFARDLFWHSKDPIPHKTELLKLLQQMWETGLYHLRLEAVDLARYAVNHVEEPTRSELETLLESFLGSNVFLNSAIFEALAQYRDLGLTSEGRVREELQEILNGPRDDEACQRAATAFINQFEDIFSDHYYSAINALEGKEERDFYIMAALGMEWADFFLDSILNRLVEINSKEAYPAFKKWASPPKPEGIISDALVGAFLLSYIGLARTTDSLRISDFSSDKDKESWQTWGEILFWLHKVDLPVEFVRETCAPYWKQLQGPLLEASIDPLFEIEKYARSRQIRKQIYRPIEDLFQKDLKKIYEKALPRHSELTSILGSYAHQADGRGMFMIEELGRLGDEESIPIIEPYVESAAWGRSAVKAIRCIRARLTETHR